MMLSPGFERRRRSVCELRIPHEAAETTTGGAHAGKVFFDVCLATHDAYSRTAYGRGQDARLRSFHLLTTDEAWIAHVEASKPEDVEGGTRNILIFILTRTRPATRSEISLLP